jgi:hypothetical protein
MTAVTASATAMEAICASDVAIAKYAVSAAGLNPADYSSMTQVAASQTAMTAVAASQTALDALNASSLKKTYTVNTGGQNVNVSVYSGKLLVLSLVASSITWTASNFIIPDKDTVTFTSTNLSLCKTANNLLVSCSGSATGHTATITGIPV